MSLRDSIDLAVYLVTDRPAAYARGLLAGVEAALVGGVTVVQYRATGGARREQFESALALRALTTRHHVPLIINDSVDLALAVGADGVHVGQGDLPAAVVRRLIGPDRVLGVSANQPAHVDAIDATIVDYAGIGPVYPTTSKADAAPALGIEGLRSLVARCGVPVVAIGGITVARAPEVFAAGVAGVAVVAALSFATDPAGVARQLRAARGESE